MKQTPPTGRGTGGMDMTMVFGARAWGGDGRGVTGPLLARATSLAWGWTHAPALGRSPRGKPFFLHHPCRWLSLSHSGGYALCALSDDGPVGVDIEMVRPHRPQLPTYALSPEELAGFDGSWEEFARLWTLKESWCKMGDTPLYPPRRVRIPPDCPCRSYAGTGWRAAVCGGGALPGEIRWLSLEPEGGGTTPSCQTGPDVVC